MIEEYVGVTPLIWVDMLLRFGSNRTVTDCDSNQEEFQSISWPKGYLLEFVKNQKHEESYNEGIFENFQNAEILTLCLCVRLMYFCGRSVCRESSYGVLYARVSEAIYERRRHNRQFEEEEEEEEDQEASKPCLFFY